MSLEEEKAFWDQWREKAMAGTLVCVSQMREAFGALKGTPVAESSFCRMLKRHGWRKIAPHSHHSKSDSEQ